MTPFARAEVLDEVCLVQLLKAGDADVRDGVLGALAVGEVYAVELVASGLQDGHVMWRVYLIEAHWAFSLTQQP